MADEIITKSKLKWAAELDYKYKDVPSSAYVKIINPGRTAIRPKEAREFAVQLIRVAAEVDKILASAPPAPEIGEKKPVEKTSG